MLIESIEEYNRIYNTIENNKKLTYKININNQEANKE